MQIPIVSKLADAIMGKPKEPLDEDMYVPMEIPKADISQFTQPQFQESFYRQAELNLQVESKGDLIRYINNAGLSLRCETALVNFVHTMFDRNILLTDCTGKNIKGGTSSDEQILIAYWRFEISLLGLKNSAFKSDMKNPAYPVIINALKDQFWYRIKRTKGTQRERIAQGNIQISYNAKQTISRAKPEQ